MKDSIRLKLERLAARQEEVAALLAAPGATNDTNLFRDLSQEYARLDPLARKFRGYREAEGDLKAAEDMSRDSDPGMRRQIGRAHV